MSRSRTTPPFSSGSDDRDDDALVQACLKGDESAWETLIVRYRRLIFSIPLQCGLDASEADDVFQTVSLKLMENLSKIRQTASVASWIATTTRRESWRRSQLGTREEVTEPESFERQTADEQPELVERLDAVEREHTLALAFERLDEPCHSLLHALYVEDPSPSYKEISERIGRPVGSLGPTRARCLKKLERLFTRLGGSVPRAK